MSAQARAPGQGVIVAGKYRVRRVIGQGGMGRVVEAMHEAVGKPVALKCILDADDPQARARVHREARATARVHHANVVDVYDVIEHQGDTYIVMELVRGEPLHALLARRTRLEVPEAVALMVEVARGIAAAHRAGVVHRDLKPSNLIVREPGAGVRVTVVDFGISRLAGPVDVATTGSAGVAGTPQYMAPEQVRGERVDARADVYAMGAVLYEMLTGRAPHVRQPVSALLVEIATVAPTPAHLVRPDLPVALSEVIGRALAKRPDERYASAEAFERALLPFSPYAVDPAPIERAEGALGAPTSNERPLDAPTLEPTGETHRALPGVPTGHGGRDAPATPLDAAATSAIAPSGRRWRAGLGAVAIIAASVVAAVGISRGQPRAEMPRASVEPPRTARVETSATALPPVEAPPPADETREAPPQPRVELASEAPPQTVRRRWTERTEPETPAVRRARGVRTRGISADEF